MVGSGFNGHLFRAFNQSTESKLAFKVIPVENLLVNNLLDDEDERQTYLDEAKKANLLQHPSVIKCHDIVPYRSPDNSIRCIIFVYDYVEGKNLRDYIRQHRAEINVSFAETFLRTMLELLYELKQRGYPHGDLHAGNVLVAKSEFDIYGRTTFRVTDFGVRELTDIALYDAIFLSQNTPTTASRVEYRTVKGGRYVSTS